MVNGDHHGNYHHSHHHNHLNHHNQTIFSAGTNPSLPLFLSKAAQFNHRHQQQFGDFAKNQIASVSGLCCVWYWRLGQIFCRPSWKIDPNCQKQAAVATDKFQNNRWRKSQNCWCRNGPHTILKSFKIIMNGGSWTGPHLCSRLIARDYILVLHRGWTLVCRVSWLCVISKWCLALFLVCLNNWVTRSFDVRHIHNMCWVNCSNVTANIFWKAVFLNVNRPIVP